MMQPFFETVPVSLEEAALVDGARTRTIFLKIVLPMVAPGIAATAILCFLYAWNDFFFALILTRTSARTAPMVDFPDWLPAKAATVAVRADRKLACSVQCG